MISPLKDIHHPASRNQAIPSNSNTWCPIRKSNTVWHSDITFLFTNQKIMHIPYSPLLLFHSLYSNQTDILTILWYTMVLLSSIPLDMFSLCLEIPLSFSLINSYSPFKTQLKYHLLCLLALQSRIKIFLTWNSITFGGLPHCAVIICLVFFS